MEQTENIEIKKKKFSLWRFLKRILTALILSIIGLAGISAILVIVYEDDVKDLIIKELNKHLNTEVRVEPKNIDLTILSSFPHCALEFKNILALEATSQKEKDTLLYAGKLALEFNIKDLFDKNYTIKQIVVSDAVAKMKIDKKGQKNFLVWKSADTQTGSDSLVFSLEKIVLENINYLFKDSKHKIKVYTQVKHLEFSGQFNNDNYILKSEGEAFVNVFQIENVKYLEYKKLRFDNEMDVNKNTYTIRKSETEINTAKLASNGAFLIKDSLISLDIFFNGKNLDIASTLSLLPEKFQNQITDYQSTGEFYAHGEIHYTNGLPLTANSKFGIKNATITYKPKNTTLTKVNLIGDIVINENRSAISLKNIQANLNTNTFTGDVEILNFKDPYLKLGLTANTNLSELVSFYPIDTIQEISGAINLQANIEGLISDIKSNAYSPGIRARGQASLSNLKAIFKHSEKELNIPQGELSLLDRNVNVNNLKLIKGKSDVSLIGQLPNFLGYLFDASVPLTITAEVNSDNIELEDFLFASSDNPSSSSVNISDKLDFSVKVNVNHLTFGKFEANSITGNLFLKNQKAALQNLRLSAADGTIAMNTIADASGDQIKISGDCELNKLNIQKLFTALNNFGQNTIQDKNLKGFVTASVDFSSTWNKQLKVDPFSINATSSILIERGELNNFKPLESLAKYIDITELRNIKFSTLQSAVEIKNKMITLPKTSIKSNAINLELWGKHSFDNIIDYHIQILMSELIAKRPNKNKDFDEELSLVENDPENRRSLFIVMSGPIDNPTFKYDKKGAKEKIKEDIKQEKQNLKQILKDEFGLFKKDTIKLKEQEKANQKFNIQFGDEKPKKTNTTLQPKKKEEEDDF